MKTWGLIAAAGVVMGLGGCDDVDPASTATKAARQTQTVIGEASLSSIATSVQSFMLDMDRLPTEAEGLGALVSLENVHQDTERWNGPYMGEANLKDRHGNPIVYERSKSGFRLIALGSDGERGGDGLAADAEFEGKEL